MVNRAISVPSYHRVSFVPRFKPEIRITSPTNSGSIIGAPIKLEFDARDPESGLKHPPVATLDGATVTTGQSVTPTLGYHTLTATVENRQGLKAEKVLTFPVTYKIQWLPPLGSPTSQQGDDGNEAKPPRIGRFVLEDGGTLPVRFRALMADGSTVADQNIVVVVEGIGGANTATQDGNQPSRYLVYKANNATYHFNFDTSIFPWVTPGPIYRVIVSQRPVTLPLLEHGGEAFVVTNDD